MNREGTPPAAVFDPSAEEVPPVLREILVRTDLPVLLLVAADAEGPAQDMAVRMAEVRSRAHLPTLLADADLDAPRLHAHLGLPNHEGLTDLFLFGASVARVALSPEGETFRFIPAGAYAPDPAEVLESTRWDHISGEMDEDGTTLLVFAPGGAPGLRTLSTRASGAILMAPPAAVDRLIQRLDPDCPVLAVLDAPPETTGSDGPAQGGAEASVGATSGDAPGTAAAGAASVGPATSAAGAAMGAPGADSSAAGEAEGAGVEDARVGPGPAEPDLTEPPVIRKKPDERRHFPVVLVLLLVVLLAAWFGYQHFFAPPPLTEAPAEQRVAATPEPDRGAPVETPLPYSIAVEAHQDLNSALDRAQRLNASDAGTTFYLAPVAVNGGVFYRLLAGPATDREAAERLMEGLVASGHKTAVDEWAILPTSHAFLLGEFDTIEAADARVDSLAALGVPAYRLSLRYLGGQRGYRVWGGAYASESEAAVMEDLLEEAGVNASLVPRTGEANR